MLLSHRFSALPSVFVVVVAVGTIDSTSIASEETAADLVREALHREIYGQQSDRQSLLARAVQASEDFALARWHLGQVQYRGSWRPIDQVALFDDKRPQLKTYERRRAETADSLEGNLALADFCRGRGLEMQERAHLLRVLDFAPDHAQARNRLGYRFSNGEWYTRDEWRSAVAAEESQQRDSLRWRPEMIAIRDGLNSSDPAIRDEAKRKLASVRDLSAVQAMEAVLSVSGENASLLVLEAIGRMQGEQAVASLVRHAVFSPSFRVQEDAARRLSLLPREQYVPRMLAALYSPTATATAVVPTATGVTVRQAYAREAQDENQMLVLDTSFRPVRRIDGNGQFPLRENILNTTTSSAWMVNQGNLRTQLLNARIAAALNRATGQQLPAEPQRWWQWWLQENDMAQQGGKQTRVRQGLRQVAVAEQPSPFQSVSLGQPTRRAECFVAGTPVFTALGPKAIEQVRTGDVVLSQNVETGELSFKPVIGTTSRPPEPLVNVQVDDEVFRTTGGHLFWVSGGGWCKATDLQAGMNLHTAAGSALVIDVVPSDAGETFNLEVADFNTYFVGSDRILSHDVTERRPTYVIVPGLSDQ